MKEQYQLQSKGHKLFELNTKTVNIKIVEPIGECLPDCIYATALNVKNVEKRFVKKIALFRKLNELNIPFKQFKNGGLAIDFSKIPEGINIKQLLK